MVKKLKYSLILAASSLSLSFTIPTITYIAKNLLVLSYFVFYFLRFTNELFTV